MAQQLEEMSADYARRRRKRESTDLECSLEGEFGRRGDGSRLDGLEDSVTRLLPVPAELDLCFEQCFLPKGGRQRFEEANLEAFGAEGAGRREDEPEEFVEEDVYADESLCAYFGGTELG